MPPVTGLPRKGSAIPSPGIELIQGGQEGANYMANPLKPTSTLASLHNRPKMHKRSATGLIVGPNESLKTVFPEGSNSKAWTQAIKATELKNSIEDIEARSVSYFISRDLLQA